MLDDPQFLKKQDGTSFLGGLYELDQSLTLFCEEVLASLSFELTQGWLVLPQNWAAKLAAELWRQSTASSHALIVDDDLVLRTKNLRSSIILLGQPPEETQELLDKRLADKNPLILVTSKSSTKKSQLIHKIEFQSQSHPLIDIYFYYQALLCLSAGKDFKVDFSYLKRLNADWGAKSPSDKNLAKRLAYDVLGQTIIVLASKDYSCLVEKWQLTLQKINQQLVWPMIYATDNDAPFAAWRKQVFDKNYQLLNLAVSFDSHLDFYQDQCRQLSGLMPTPFEVKIQSQNMLEEYLSFCLFSDYLAFYLAVLNNNTVNLKA